MQRWVSSVGRHTAMLLTDSRHSGSRCWTVSRQKPLRFVHGHSDEFQRGDWCVKSAALWEMLTGGGCQVNPGPHLVKGWLLKVSTCQLRFYCFVLMSLRQLPARHKSPWHPWCYFKCCTQKVTGGRKPWFSWNTQSFLKSFTLERLFRSSGCTWMKGPIAQKRLQLKAMYKREQGLRQTDPQSAPCLVAWLEGLLLSCTQTCRIYSSPTRCPDLVLDIRWINEWITVRTRKSSQASQPGGQTSLMTLQNTVTC